MLAPNPGRYACSVVITCKIRGIILFGCFKNLIPPSDASPKPSRPKAFPGDKNHLILSHGLEIPEDVLNWET